MTVKRALEMAETATQTANRAMELGHKTSERITGLEERHEGHVRECAANNRRIDGKLDSILDGQKSDRKIRIKYHFGGYVVLFGIIGIMARALFLGEA